MQNDNMSQLEMQIRALCAHLQLDPLNMLEKIDTSLRSSLS
mgnify:CR=1 FL=1